MPRKGGSEDILQSAWNEGLWFTHGKACQREPVFCQKGTPKASMRSIWLPIGKDTHPICMTFHGQKSQTMVLVMIPKLCWEIYYNISSTCEVCQFPGLKREGGVQEHVIWGKGPRASASPQSSSPKQHMGLRHLETCLQDLHQWFQCGAMTGNNIDPPGIDDFFQLHFHSQIPKIPYKVCLTRSTSQSQHPNCRCSFLIDMFQKLTEGSGIRSSNVIR